MKNVLCESMMLSLVSIQADLVKSGKDYHAQIPDGWNCNCNSDNPCANGCRNSCSGVQR